MSRSAHPSRRAFLQHASALGALAGTGAPLALQLAAMSQAAAQSASNDYRALVCIFMYGGNDAFNMVLPTDQPSWDAYALTRNRSLSATIEPSSVMLAAPGAAPSASAPTGSNARLGGVLPIVPQRAQGRSFALHPSMAAAQDLFNTHKRLAVVANVGPLRLPTNKAQYKNPSHLKPLSLFSHNDQQNTWQAFAPEGATRGWGGRIGDLLMSANGAESRFTAVSAAGNAVWLSGTGVRQYQVSVNGAVRMGGFDWEGGQLYGSKVMHDALKSIASTSRTSHVLERDVAAVAARSVSAEARLSGALPAADSAPWTDTLCADPWSGQLEQNALAQQLQVVARMVAAAVGASAALPMKRQVFFVSIGGFDTHDRQNVAHARLMARLSHALGYFDAMLGAIGARQYVTTFTASDFGRTFTSNGDGTDHGWGAHHFVMGGAVKGGDLYGTFPVLGVKNANDNEFDGSPDQIQNGVLLPQVSVDQFAATMGKWMGLSATQLADICPNLLQFDASQRDLGFML